jgi:mRNA degradation ribonuclease J1/J2
MFGLFNSKEKDRQAAESIIEAIHGYYNMARVKFLDKKEIFYLALVWVIYAKKHHPDQYIKNSFSSLIIPASSDTLIFSFLTSPDSIDAFAYFMINKERLSVAKEYEPKFNEIMSKIQATQEQINKAIQEMVDYLSDEMENFEGITEKDF